MKIFLLVLLQALCALNCLAQNSIDSLWDYFRQQSNLMHEAYENRDPAKYHALLSGALKKYHSLLPQQKKMVKPLIASAYYNLSCTYSLLNNKVKALEYLDSSISNGYYNYSHMQQDADLDNIRHEPRFLKLVEPTRAIGDYVYILKKAAAFNNDDNRSFPEFTYQPPGDSNLVALKKAFNLDSIAGKGNDVSKVINLMHWIHYLIPHDGNHENPKVKNAMSMINERERDKRGLNCRGLSTVLNECYLAMGFKARFVTCLPKDSLDIDPDCHVINTVFIPSLKKWIWLDPTNDAYVMNEKGELLSIAEVRQRIIDGRTFILNPDANWNRRSSVTKEQYLYSYMAKNLYMLQCPVNSKYDLETRRKDKPIEKYVVLLPLEYYDQSGADNSSFATNNEEKFWADPYQ